MGRPYLSSVVSPPCLRPSWHAGEGVRGGSLDSSRQQKRGQAPAPASRNDWSPYPGGERGEGPPAALACAQPASPTKNRGGDRPLPRPTSRWTSRSCQPTSHETPGAIRPLGPGSARVYRPAAIFKATRYGTGSLPRALSTVPPAVKLWVTQSGCPYFSKAVPPSPPPT